MGEILLILWVFYILLFFYSLRYKNNSIVDIFWGPAFVIIALYSYFFESIFSLSQTLVTLLVTAWGVRLFLNIFAKKIHDFHHEDPRYTLWRKQWKYVKTRSFFQVFLLQWVLACVVATPVWLINFASGFEESIYLTFFGGLIALFWLLYEARADGELAWFMKNKKPWDILTSGLRSFHRYPQYFGESVFWFGICVIASQISLFSFIWFVVIFFLVRYVSGVPMLEKRYQDNEKFQEYAEAIPVFFPQWNKLLYKK